MENQKLINLIKEILEEQLIAPNMNYYPYTPLPHKYKCVSKNISLSIEYVMKQNISADWIRYGLGILARESNFGKILGRYGQKAPIEYFMNKMVEIIPGFGGVLKWGAKKVFNKDNWVPSMGIAQMTPDIAKKYAVNLESLMSISGSLYAAIRYLIDLKKELTPYYDPSQPSKIIINKQIVNNPSSTGDASLDAAIMAYNLGSSKLKKQYCKTNSLDYLAPCNSKNGLYKPMPIDKPNFILKVNKNLVVKNYIPNFKTNTTSIGTKFMNDFRTTQKNNYISSLGYLKEVVEHFKKFYCVK